MPENKVPKNTSLDPENWDDFRRQMHEVADRLVDNMQGLPDQPAWRPVPADVIDAIDEPLPKAGRGTDTTVKMLEELILPYPAGNTHPRFMGWVQGGGTTGSLLASMYEAAMNSNVGGREHVAVYVEKQVAQWMLSLFGFPASGSGILTTGTSMATLDALIIARHALLGALDSDDKAIRQTRLRIYSSKAVHSSLAKAVAIMGLTIDALHSVDQNHDGSINVTALRSAIERDREQGYEPLAIVGTVGTVSTGAIDDLKSLADIADAENIWLHIDGAFGALAILLPELEAKFEGISRAKSVAFDFHKWGQVSYECGCLLVHDKEQHRAAFSKRESYLASYDRGISSSDHWFCDYGPELSRSFRALKVWFLLQEHGTDALAASMRNSCAIATYLENEIGKYDELELLSPALLNIVCFRVKTQKDDDADAFNNEIVADLQEQGIAVPSTTVIDGKLAIRCCFINHRTTVKDVDILLSNIISLAK